MFSEETILNMAKCTNAMYIWMSNYLVTRHDMMIDDQQASSDLTILFINILQFYKIVFEGNLDYEKDESNPEFKVKSSYIKYLTEFLVFTSNDVISTKYPIVYQEISKETVNYLCRIVNNLAAVHPAQISLYFAKVNLVFALNLT